MASALPSRVRDLLPGSANGVRSATLHTILTQVALYPLGMLNSVLIARVLGPSGRGTYALASLCASLASTLMGSLNAPIAFHAARGTPPSAELMSNGLAISLLLSTPSLGAMAAGLLWLNGELGWLAFSGAMATVLAFTSCLSGLLLGTRDVRGLNVAHAISTALQLLLTAALLLGMRAGLRGALTAWLAGALVALLWLGCRSRLELGGLLRAALSAERMRSLAAFALKIGATNGVGFLTYRADSFLVARFLGVRALGIYSVAVTCAEMLWFVSRAVATAIYGKMGAQPRAAATRFTAKVLRHTSVVLGAAAIGIALGGRLLIPLVFGSPFRESVGVLFALLPGNLCYGLATIFSAYFTNHLGRPDIPLAIAGLSLAVNLCASLVLIPLVGPLGGAAASSAAYLVGIVAFGMRFSRATGVGLAEVLWPTREEWREQARWLSAPGQRGWGFGAKARVIPPEEGR